MKKLAARDFEDLLQVKDYQTFPANLLNIGLILVFHPGVQGSPR